MSGLNENIRIEQAKLKNDSTLDCIETAKAKHVSFRERLAARRVLLASLSVPNSSLSKSLKMNTENIKVGLNSVIKINESAVLLNEKSSNLVSKKLKNFPISQPQTMLISNLNVKNVNQAIESKTDSNEVERCKLGLNDQLNDEIDSKFNM